MQEEVNSIIGHMAKSQVEMARMLEAKRQSIFNVAHIVTALPNETVGFGGTDVISANAMELAKSVTAYLNSLADLEDAIADQTELVIKELAERDEE